MTHVPSDRTSSQPVMAKCFNPPCAVVSGEPYRFRLAGDEVRCDKCGSDDLGTVRLEVLIHLLLPDANGPITGMHGRKWKIGCDEARAYLATATNMEAATVLLEAANCPGCLAAHAAGPQLVT